MGQTSLEKLLQTGVNSTRAEGKYVDERLQKYTKISASNLWMNAISVFFAQRQCFHNCKYFPNPSLVILSDNKRRREGASQGWKAETVTRQTAVTLDEYLINALRTDTPWLLFTYPWWLNALTDRHNRRFWWLYN